MCRWLIRVARSRGGPPVLPTSRRASLPSGRGPEPHPPSGRPGRPDHRRRPLRAGRGAGGSPTTGLDGGDRCAHCRFRDQRPGVGRLDHGGAHGGRRGNRPGDWQHRRLQRGEPDAGHGAAGPHIRTHRHRGGCEAPGGVVGGGGDGLRRLRPLLPADDLAGCRPGVAHPRGAPDRGLARRPLWRGAAA